MTLLKALGLPPPKRGLASAAATAAPTARQAGAEQPAQRGDHDTPATGAPPGGSPAATPVATGSAGGAQPAAQGGPAAVAKPATPGNEVLAYAKERKEVKALADALNTHPQAARISALLAQIATKMASAGGHATKPDWPKAMADLAAARALCVTAKKNADDWQTYSKRRAVVADLGTSLKGLDDTNANNVAGWVATADGMMAATPPKFTDAMNYLQQIDAAMRPSFQGKVNAIKNALAKVEAQGAAVQTFLAKEIAEGRKIVADLGTAFSADNWAKVVMLWREGWDVLGGCERYGQRRIAYETQRATTLAEVNAVKALPPVRHHGPSLDAQLAQADALASHAQMKMEDGVKKLVALATRCAALKAVAPTVQAHDAERKAADADFAALEKQAAAAPALAEPVKQIRTLLTQAAEVAARARSNTGDPTAQWQPALLAVQRARADLATAKTLAAGLGPTTAAKTAADGGDAAAMKKALAALQADAAAAAKAPHADQAAEAFGRCTTQADAAAKALAGPDPKSAAGPLRLAADALAAARAIQTGHAQFVATLADAEAQLAQLRALKTAKAIAPRIDAVAGGIANAKAHAARHDSAAAIAALRVATDAVAAARRADADRQAYDALAKKVSDRLPEVTDANLKKTLAKDLEEAGKKADALTFGDAQKALKALLVKIDEVKLKAGMKATPPDPKLRDIAKAMVANGGAAAVDAAIQDSPATQPKVITELASARYGKEFKFEGSAPGEHEVKSLKRCCEVFAKIADDIVDNPSIKDVSHVDAVGGAGGGYTSSTAHIGMEGRVGAFQQKFGKNEVNYDPKTGTNVKALPSDIDPACLPAKNDTVEYIGFAAAHEVGHGVDDLRGFMAKNGGQEKYGGWINFGGDVKPIADAVGAHIAANHGASSFWKTTESKKYVLEKLLNRNPDRPPSCDPAHPAFNLADKNAFDAFDTWHALATASDVYRRQGDCDKITIGKYIYHEAYPRAWVGYLAAARKKGLTGYQFRAPGEWFAELYAGWKSGMLGAKHPAVEWLKKL